MKRTVADKIIHNKKAFATKSRMLKKALIMCAFISLTIFIGSHFTYPAIVPLTGATGVTIEDNPVPLAALPTENFPVENASAAGLMPFLELFLLDIKTIISVLCWGNLLYSGIIFTYQLYQIDSDNKRYIVRLGFAKLIQALGWSLLFFSEYSLFLPAAGTTLILFGYYLDGQGILTIIGQKTRMTDKIQTVILAVFILLYNIMVCSGINGNICEAAASAGMFAVLLIPTVKLAVNEDNGRLKRHLGNVYLFFLLLMLPRAGAYIWLDDMQLFTNNIIQNLTFIMFLMMMIFSGTAMLLMIKEDAYDRSEKMAALDDLTNLPNRRSFLLAAHTYFEWHKRAGEEVSVLFLDIDHFKKVNDIYGHSFGDDVLVSFARIIESCTREADLCCRYGGEEFLIFISSGNSEQAMNVCNRIRSEVEMVRFDSFPDFKYTISIGVASGVPAAAEKMEDFIRKSDKAMYKAKASGRNTTIVYR